MLSKKFGQFLRDERGSYTMWSLLWFILYVGIGGLAVDITDVYRNQSLLQSTADAACMAGVMSLPDTADAENKAMYYAGLNMDPPIYGNVLVREDVRFGIWDFADRKFYNGAGTPNAIYVTTRRSDDNRNPVAMNVLRIATLLGVSSPRWNVQAEAVCVRYLDECANGGFLAGEEVFWRSNSDYFRRFCIHGMEDGVAGRNGNSYEDGVRITWGPDAEADFPPPARAKTDLQNALAGTDTLWPLEAYAVNDYIDVLESLPDVSYDDFKNLPKYEQYQSWDFLYGGTEGARTPPNRATAIPAEPEPNTVYDLDCSGQLSLGQGFEIHDAAVVADCRIHAAASFSGGNVVLASRHTGGGHAVHMAAKSGLGDPDFCNPGDGGGLEIYTPGGIHMAAQGEWHGVRMVAGGDVKFTSNNKAGWGLAVVAGGRIDASSNNEFGLCPGKPLPGPVAWRYRLVQ